MRFNKLGTSLYNRSIPCAYLCSHRSPCPIIYPIAVRFIHIHDLFQSPYALLPFFYHLFFVFPQAAPDVVDEVKREIEAVKSKISENTVKQALQKLRQLLFRPTGVFDFHSAMAALEHLSDIARENGDEHAPRYNAILKQTSGLSGHQAIQRILLKLLGTKEEIVIAKEIEKATKSNPFSPPLFSSQVSKGQRPPARARPYIITCYACGLRGHIARNCRARRGRNFERY